MNSIHKLVTFSFPFLLGWSKIAFKSKKSAKTLGYDSFEKPMKRAKVSLSLLVESNVHMTHVDFTNFLKTLR